MTFWNRPGASSFVEETRKFKLVELAMRTMILVAVAVGSTLLTMPGAKAQDGIGGAVDRLDRAVNPDTPRTRDDDRYRSGSSSQAGTNYQRYDDQDLRREADRLRAQEQQIRLDEKSVTDEMDRRGLRR
jgi:hypothetical protein